MDDVIDRLVGIAPGSPLDAMRRRRPETRDNAQASYEALFRPGEPGDASIEERLAVAVFVCALHREPSAVALYAAELRSAEARPGLEETVLAVGEQAAATGPAGRFPGPVLAREGSAGPRYRVDDVRRATMGPRIAAALDHTHMLVFRPREAGRADLRALLDAGWSTTGIVTLSQAVAFLAFQIRVVAGLKVLNALPGRTSSASPGDAT